jgi:hypothetical protein
MTAIRGCIADFPLGFDALQHQFQMLYDNTTIGGFQTPPTSVFDAMTRALSDSVNFMRKA